VQSNKPTIQNPQSKIQNLNMDAELLQGFIEEAVSYLPEISEGIAAYSQNSAQSEKLANSQHQLQTIKGAASMIGLSEVGELSLSLEKEITQILADKIILSEPQTADLFQKVAQLEKVLSLAYENLADILTESSPLDESLFADLQSQTNSSAELEGFEEFEDFEEFEIDDEMLEVFAMEAGDHLQNIGTNLSILEETPNQREALLEIRRSSHTLKGSAGIVGLQKLSSLAHRMEDLLDYISEHHIEGNPKVYELLLASTECLELLTKNQSSPELEQNIAGLYQRFDQLLASLKNAEATPVSAVSKSVSEVEITMSQEEIALPILANYSEESAETAETYLEKPVPNSRSVVRVSIERLDGLVKLASEMVITRSIFEQRLIELERQIQELSLTTNRLRRSTNKLEVDFEARSLGNHNFETPKFSFSKPNNSSILSKGSGEFDTLEFDRYTEFHQTTRELIETTSDTSAIHNELDSLFSNLSLLFDSQRTLIEEMQENLLRLRMVPLSSLESRLQRTVRVTANDEGKQVELQLENAQIDIDTQILDAFVEPLIHILRNAVAHGIEPPETRHLLGKPEKGRITLKAYSEGTHIVFVVSDDGRGISVSALKEKAIYLGLFSQKEADEISDEEAFSLIFLPGLSTAEEVSQVSGRGVGMNVVKSIITHRQGDIFISSEPQKGTTFTVRLPMSLAVTRVLLVKADGQIFAFPLKLVKQIVEISHDELEVAQREKAYQLKDKSYKFYHFSELLNSPVLPTQPNSKISLLLIEAPDKPCALMVEELIKPEEVVIKPLGTLLRNVPDILGATILGDGSVVPVLDLINLLKRKPAKTKKTKAAPAKPRDQITVLIVDDSPSVRQVNSNLVKNAGWQPILARDGLEALEVLQAFREMPDIILTDVEMPRMDGYELLASLKRQELLRSIPVIMITSRAGEKHRRKAFDLGVSEYLSKPFEERMLLEKVRELVGV
jgi:chemosensory pili system protein ChpA (sensor histidine kinase/response regulator)